MELANASFATPMARGMAAVAAKRAQLAASELPSSSITSITSTTNHVVHSAKSRAKSAAQPALASQLAKPQTALGPHALARPGRPQSTPALHPAHATQLPPMLEQPASVPRAAYAPQLSPVPASPLVSPPKIRAAPMGLSVSFAADVETSWGDCVVLVGNTASLGSWQAEHGVRLATNANSYPTWTAQVALSCTAEQSTIEYKLVILRANRAGIEWEPLAMNRSLECREFSAGNVVLSHKWGVPGGAALPQADGGSARRPVQSQPSPSAGTAST